MHSNSLGAAMKTPKPSYDPSRRCNPHKKENRAWPRYPRRFKTYCQSIKEDDELLWSVQIQDLSRQGLKLVSHRCFEPGTILRIGIIHERGTLLVARAVHATQTTEGDWTIGCTFPRKLDEEEMRAWLEEKK
jgi:hypothetical protein